MRRVLGILLAAALAAPPSASAWGLIAHRWVVGAAIGTLPEPLRRHFESRRHELSELAVEPDTVLRDRDGREEAVRHFLDLDLYGAPPFDRLPSSYEEAVARFGESTVLDRGTVAWTILALHERLVEELRRRDWTAALETAGHAGHYLADATMPLHAVSNYDGQKTGQNGLHKAVEHGLVDERIAEYAERAARAITPASPEPPRWEDVLEILTESHAAAARLLAADEAARRTGRFESRRYFDEMDGRVGALLAGRLGRAVSAVGSFWLSAWVVAGKPPTPR